MTRERDATPDEVEVEWGVLPDPAARQPVRLEAGVTREREVCQWFLLCDNDADGVVEHPVLGDVPTCRRCAGLAGVVDDDVAVVQRATMNA